MQWMNSKNRKSSQGLNALLINICLYWAIDSAIKYNGIQKRVKKLSIPMGGIRICMKLVQGIQPIHRMHWNESQ
jgi:hypothetical protein